MSAAAPRAPAARAPGGRAPAARGGGRAQTAPAQTPAAPVVRGGGRAPAAGAAVRGGRPAANGAAAAPTRAVQRTGTGDESHLSNASVADVAKSDNPILKVKGDSRPNSVAGAISNIVRESGNAPSLLATGPQAINQAMKAFAIARRNLSEESTPLDLICTAKFEQDVAPRSGSNVCFELMVSEVLTREPLETDLSAKERTDIFKLGGAISGRVREGEEVNITTKGPVPVLIVTKAIAAAKGYVAENNLDLKFAVTIVDLENPEIRDATSTYLHFAVVAYQA